MNPHHPRASRSHVRVTLVTLLCLLPQTQGQVLLGALFGIFAGPCRNSDVPRCGLANLGYVVRTGLAGTSECREDVCVLLPALNNDNLVCDGTPCGNITGTVPPEPSSFDITLDMEAVPFSDRSRFRTAATRWERIITSDLSDIATVELPNPPRYDTCRYPTGTVDDLYICAAYVTRDGVGGTLGFATVGFVRAVDGLPITGTMSFDTADVPAMRANGDFDAVLLHEIGHLLGIGTRWEGQGIAGPNAAGCPYLGARATDEYRAVSGCRTLPTEQDGGGGTVCSHFDEQCLQRELMTGAVNTGVQNFLSRISIASLEDLGYDVSYTTADAFRSTQLGPGCACRRRLGDERAIGNATVVPPQRPRRLSDKMRQFAEQEGQWYLSTQPSLPVATMAELSQAGVHYVGDQYVSVIVLDTNGEIFDVTVFAK